MRKSKLLIIVLAVSGAGSANAEIVSAAANGFNIRHVFDAPNVAPPVVWAALADVSKWWDPEHTYSGDSNNLRLDPYVQGCFCEKLSLYAGIEHARVVYAQPTKLLRLSGAIGPLQEFGVNGSMTWQIEAASGGSRVTFTYNAGGYADRPLADWAPIVDEVLGGQVARLGRYLTAGRPEEKPAEKKEP